MNDYDKGWLSAFIDSEGSFNLTNHVITIVNTNFMMLLKAQQFLGGTWCVNSNPGLTCWILKIHPKHWRNWLADFPLIEKENQRQLFLLWDASVALK